MRQLKNLKFKYKLIAIILSITIMTLAVAFAVAFIYNRKTLHEYYIDKAQTITSVVGNGIIGAIALGTPTEIEEELTLILVDAPDIKNAVVFDERDKLYAQYHQSKTDKFKVPPVDKNDVTQLKDGYFHIFRAVYYKNRWYGTLYLRVSTEKLDERTKNLVLSMMGILLLIILFSFLLASKLQGIISGPIFDLVRINQEVSSEGNYSIRVQKTSNDEVGMLYDSFNEMMEQMHLRKIERDKVEEELRHSEQALKESENKLDTILSSMVDLVFVFDKEGRFTFSRCPAEELYLPQEKFIGKKYSEVMPPQSNASFEKAFQQNKNGEVAEYEYSLEVSGQIKWYSAKLSPMFSGYEFSGVVAVIRNITERKLLDDELKKAEEKYRSIFENAVLGIFQTTPDGRILIANPAIARILGYNSTEALMKSITNLGVEIYADPEKREELMNLVRRQGFVEGFEFMAHRKDKTIVHLSVNMHEIRDESQNLLYYEGIMEDITEKKRAEGLKIAKDTAEAANKAKSEFLANMSHEIRTPMNAILGFAELLEEKIHDEQQKSYLSSIISSGRTLLSLINDILDLAKIEAGKLEMKYAAFNPRSILNEIKQIYSHEVYARGLEFILEIDPLLPECLLLDEVRLRQILFNLVGNAVKFTEKGYIKVGLNKQYKKKDHSSLDLIFIVEDTGIGIPDNQQDLVFEPFKQQEGQRTAKYEGTGLGLSITRRLVEMMGGAISLESKTGKGSTFKVMFNNVQVASIIETEESVEKINIDTITFEKATILIVDDIESNRALIRGFINLPPFTLIEARNGKEAVALAGQHRPDLIFMDMRMPEMDGYEATRTLKADDMLKTIPVVALTASAMKQHEQAAKAAGCDSYLRKPITRTKLLIELMRFLPYSKKEEPLLEEKDKARKEKETIIETLTPEIKAKLPGLLTILEGELTDKWNEINKTFVIDEIEEFANIIKGLGEEHSLGVLSSWGGRLTDQAKKLDMEKMPGTLMDFPALITKIKKTIST